MITIKSWYLLLPANLIYTIPIFIFGQYFSKGISFHILNYMSFTYMAIFGILYGIITFQAYPQTPSKIFFRYNFFNLAISIALSCIFDRILEHWEWFFYMLSSWQNLVVVWVELFIWQCFVRFLAWIKYS